MRDGDRHVHSGADERRTIAEWEQEYGLVILDYDGFEAIADPGQALETQRFTRAQFEQAVASCTVVWRGRTGHRAPREDLARLRRERAGVFPDAARAATEVTIPPPVQSASTKPSQASPSREAVDTGDAPALQRRTRRRSRSQLLGRWRRRWLVWFTLPALAEWAASLLLRWARERLGIRWWWSAALGAAALFVTCVVPGTTLLSGPLFIWYELVRWSAGLMMAALGHAAHAVLGGTPPAWTATPGFLAEMVWFGTPLPDYFTVSRAITSSVVLGVLVAAAEDLWARTRASGGRGAAAGSADDIQTGADGERP